MQNKKIPEKIIANLDFFDENKELFFILQKYSSLPIRIKKEGGKEINGKKREIIFNSITKEVYEKLKRNGKEHIIVKIVHQNSKLNEELQALDLICGSIFDWVEYNNKDYYEILTKRKMQIEGGKTAFNKK